LYLLCENHKFNRIEILNLIKNDVYEIGAYPKDDIEKAIKNAEYSINKLIRFSLNDLTEKGISKIELQGNTFDELYLS
jgi:hypothetical protein